MDLINRLFEMLGSGMERAWRDNLIALVQSYGYSQVLYGIVPNKWAPLEVHSFAATMRRSGVKSTMQGNFINAIRQSAIVSITQYR